MTAPADTSSVRFDGDISPEHQYSILKFSDIILRGKGKFARPTGERVEMTEVSLYKREEDGKAQIRMSFEVDVDEDMLNPAGMMHGGCSMYLIDVCSSIALVSLSIATKNSKDTHLVSQAITTVFHAPAQTGSRLRIVNTTVSFGARTVTARTEIWDITNGRLVATGVHNQMQPSAPKL